MGRKKKSSFISAWSVLGVVGLGIVFAYPLIAAIAGGVALGCWLLFRWLRDKESLPLYDMTEVDTLSGPEFEEFVADLFCRLGYTAKTTQQSRDFGVDVVARCGSERIAIQVKRYSQPVSLKAVQEVVAGMHKYDCNRAVVVTNNFFTSSAIELARHSSCDLIDRDDLAKLIRKAAKDSSPGPEEVGNNWSHDNPRSNSKTVVSCSHCGQKLRLPTGRKGSVLCPSCDEEFFVST